MRVIHRDIKPENIMIMGRENNGYLNVKLIDFGTAKIFEIGNMQKGLVGSSYYIAPEVIRGKYDESCDIWSIGVIMYIMLTGVPPFYGNDDDSILRHVTEGKYDTTIDAYINLSENAKDLIRKLLKFYPNERITAKEALNKLSGRVLSLFWCGKKIPLTLKWTCERSKVRYWDETIDRSGLFETAPDIPMVQFSGNSNIVKTTMLSLKSLLINDDYNPLLISDRERAYLYGFKKLYQKTDILVYAHHFIPDIILIDSKEKVNDEEEITVECSSDGFKITNDTVAESADDIEQLYYTIKSIYSG